MHRLCGGRAGGRAREDRRARDREDDRASELERASHETGCESLFVVAHAGDSGYTSHGYAKDGFSAAFGDGAGRPSIKMLTMERAIYDFLASLIFDQLFERHTNLRIASVENGAEFLPDLFRKFKSINRKIPGLFKEDPV